MPSASVGMHKARALGTFKFKELSRRLKSAGILKTKMPAAVLRIEDAVRDLEQRN